MNRISILLADDHRFVRKAFRTILENEADLEVVGEAKNGPEAVAMVRRLHPALVLMDVTMPLLNGVQATRQILDANPCTKVLMLSIHNDEMYVRESIKSGAMGYLIKHACAPIICTAIREVIKGNMFFSPCIPSHFQKQNEQTK